MSLILPPFYFANEADLNTGTPGTSVGLAVTANASANTDGTAVALLTAVAFDVHLLQIVINSGGSSGTDTAGLVDILIDRAGGSSWGSFIDDLAVGYSGVTTSVGIAYTFPVWAKSGSSFGAQVRSATGSTAYRIASFSVYGNPSRPDMWWCGQGVETLGVTAASSKGTAVTPGSTGAAGTWTSIGSTTTYRYGAIQLGIQGSDSAALTRGGFWQIGKGSQQLPGSPTMWTNMSSTETMSQMGWGLMPIWCDVAPGTQMQARGTLSGTAEDYTLAIYGVY